MAIDKNKRGGLLKLTSEYLAWILGIEEASRIAIWQDKSSDIIYIKYNDAKERSDIQLNYDIAEAAEYPLVYLDSEFYKKLWAERLQDKPKVSTFTRSYTSDQVDITLLQNNEPIANIKSLSHTITREMAPIYMIPSNKPPKPSRIISGCFIPENPIDPNILQKPFDIRTVGRIPGSSNGIPTRESAYAEFCIYNIVCTTIPSKDNLEQLYQFVARGIKPWTRIENCTLDPAYDTGTEISVTENNNGVRPNG